MRRASNPNYVKFGPAETVVMLAKDRGELRTNDSGEFFFRELMDGRFTCASPDLERQLINSGVRAGQQVGITRATYNRAAVWTVRPIGRIAQMPPAVHASTSKPKVKPNGLPEQLYAKPEPPAPAFPEAETPATTATAVQPNPQGPTLITRCMRAAVDAAADATARGHEIGLQVAFGAAEIQALACTLYIQASKTLSSPDGRQVARKPNGHAGYVNSAAAEGA
jgi:hypothetical protein